MFDLGFKISFADMMVVLFYLVATLAWGMIAGRNVKTIKDYAVGDGKFITPVLFATIAATWIGGGSTLSMTEKVFKFGICYIFIFFCEGVSMFVLSEFFARKIHKFKGLISAGELMGEMFGKKARIITGIAGSINAAGVIGVQIAGMGYIFNTFLGMDPFHGAVLGCGIVVLYTSFGGIRAVTYTDVVQLAFLVVSIPIVCNIGLSKLGGYTGLIERLPKGHISFFPGGAMPDWKVIYYMVLFCVPFIRPQLIQRILMARDAESCVRSFRYSGFMLFPFYAVVGTVGLVAFALNPEIKPSNAFPYVVTELMPDGVKGLVLAGLVAVIMSTADSQLNTASISVVHDVLKPLLGRELKAKTELILAKLTTLIFGVAAIIVATSSKSLIDLIFSFINFWGPVVTFPLMFGVSGMRASQKTFLFSGAAGFGTFLVLLICNWEQYVPIETLVPSCLMNITVYLTLYYKEKRAENKPEILPAEVVHKPSRFLKMLRVFKIANLPKMALEFSSSRVKYYGAQYITFAAFAVLNYLLPYFMWTPPHEMENLGVELTLRVISGTLCVVLMMKDYLSEKVRKYLPVYWHFTLMFCLPLYTTYMFLENNASTIWLVNLALSLFLLSVLVDWISFCILFVTGSFLGYQLFVISHDVARSLHFTADTYFITVYITLFSILIGALFSRKKEYSQQQFISVLEEKIEERTQSLQSALSAKHEFLNNLSHEIRTPVHGVSSFSEVLRENWDGMDDAAKKEIVTKLSNASDRLYEFVEDIFDISGFITGKKIANQKEVYVSKLLNDVVSKFENIAEKLNYSIFVDGKNDAMLSLDKTLISKAFSNIIDNSIKFGGIDNNIEITIDKVQMDFGNGMTKYVKISFKDTGIGIPVNEIENVFTPFYQSSRTKSKAGGKGLGLAVTKEIIEAHDGKIWAEKVPSGAEIVVLLPE